MRKKTTADFIREAKRTHGRKYDYSLVSYNNTHTKVIINCLVHGKFEQKPVNHLRGDGCPECAHIFVGHTRRKSQNDFIREATKIHKGKYNYSLVSYKTAIQKVRIICKVHGEFEQTPNSHLQGRSCQKCGRIIVENARRRNQKDFIKEVRAVHKGKYDYSLVCYKNNSTNITIKCPIHGAFKQTPACHRRGCGCPKCGDVRGSAVIRKSQKDFIREARQAHGRRYNYSLTSYKNIVTKIKIICPIHGEFEQRPNNHLRGEGCHKCGVIKRIEKRRKSQENFIKEAKQVHSDQYDYSLVSYESYHTKIIIKCSIHGEFEQMAGNHLKGNGCPECGAIQAWTTKIWGDCDDFSAGLEVLLKSTQES